MVSHKSITIQLHSQYDARTIPEYAESSQSGAISTPGESPQHSAIHQTTVYIPIYLRSQFWIRYSVSPPYPPSSFFYFKFYIDGSHVVSWGCGEEDKYKGTTMFGLFRKPATKGKGKVRKEEQSQGRDFRERRGFFFPGEDGDSSMISAGNNEVEDDRVMEVKVYRSNARIRVPKVYEERRKPVSERYGSIDLRDAGKAVEDRPQRFYKYALLDALDQPFAVFRFLYRTWDELLELGVVRNEEKAAVTGQPSTTSSMETRENYGRVDVAEKSQRQATLQSILEGNEHNKLPQYFRSRSPNPVVQRFERLSVRSPSPSLPAVHRSLAFSHGSGSTQQPGANKGRSHVKTKPRMDAAGMLREVAASAVRRKSETDSEG